MGQGIWWGKTGYSHRIYLFSCEQQQVLRRVHNGQFATEPVIRLGIGFRKIEGLIKTWSQPVCFPGQSCVKVPVLIRVSFAVKRNCDYGYSYIGKYLILWLTVSEVQSIILMVGHDGIQAVIVLEKERRVLLLDLQGTGSEL